MKIKLYIIIFSIVFLHNNAYANDHFENEIKNQNSRTLSPDVLPQQAHKISNAISPEAAVIEQKASISLQGIDVSHYQGIINWENVKKYNHITYVYIKATDGTKIIDSKYKYNLENSRRVGLKAGSYHFYRPNMSINQQFKNFCSVVETENQDLIPIIDIERRGYGYHSNYVKNLRLFIEKVTNYFGKKPLLYTFQNFYNHYLNGLFPDYNWMIANFKDDNPTLRNDQKFIIWQYSSKGRLKGIEGCVDKSVLLDEKYLNNIIYQNEN